MFKKRWLRHYSVGDPTVGRRIYSENVQGGNGDSLKWGVLTQTGRLAGVLCSQAWKLVIETDHAANRLL